MVSILSSGWHWWISLPWNVWLDQTDKVVKITAVLVGGAWAYTKFVKGRVFHTRLEATVSGQCFRRDDKNFLVAVVKLKNVGASKIDIEQKGTGLRVFGCGSFADVTVGKPIEWTRIVTQAVFQQHGWIEASETIDDTALIVLPAKSIAIKLELRVVAKKIEWGAKTIVDVPAEMK